MKKYVIKNSDGSEQHVMQAVHASSKEAGETLWDYLLDHNDGGALCRYDEGWVSPFDFIIEEVECKDVSEVITDFESARKILGLKPNDGLSVTQRLIGGGVINLADVSHLVEDINPKHIEALIALNKLFTIAEAWNKEDGFVPDFSDLNQDKWFPWFVYDKDAAGFVCTHTHYAPSGDGALIGSRLCFKSCARAAQFGKQFADLYNKVFLLNNAE
nr:MAG TPA: hypothetical protein [Caudoviricetes sp.]